MKFLIDAQLPPALAGWLIERGHDAVHVADIGLMSATDRTIWDRVTQIEAAIVTKDEDFVTLRLEIGKGPTVVWVRIGNCRRAELLKTFDNLLPALLAALDRGESIVEVL